MVLSHALVSVAGGMITIVLALLIYRKNAPAIWGWAASFLPDLPVFWLAPLGVTGLGTTLFLTHTLGIFISPILLVLLDILLIEIWMLRYVSWLPFPESMRNVKLIIRLVAVLERYNAIPRPARIIRVYTIGVLSGVIHLLLNLWVGSF